MSFLDSNRPLALITGGANGIGLATAEKLASQGYDLYLIDKDSDNLDLAKRKIALTGAKVEIQALDLSNAATLDAAISQLVANYEIDALVNNAGVGFARTVGQTTQAEWDLTFAVNITAQFIICKHVVPQMIARGGGVIVNVASAGALVGLKNRVAYCSSKAAVVGLTRCIAADYAMDGL